MTQIKTHLLDASALIKLFIDEEKSEIIRDYFFKETVFWTTSLCFAETLGVFKRKFLSNKEDFTKNEYALATDDLIANIRIGTIAIEEVDITQIDIFNETEKIVRNNKKIDFVDAFQIITLKKGFPSSLIEDSQTIFITADKGLADLAREEGIRVWNGFEKANTR